MSAEQASKLGPGFFPEEFWDAQDDKCECTFQRIGMWTNPYLGETLEVRMCCIWGELYKLFPEHVRVVDAFKDGNAKEWVPEARDWDAEFPMPKAIWYRQLARREGITVDQARQQYQDRDDERPQGITPIATSQIQLSVSQLIAYRTVNGIIEQQQGLLAAILKEAGADTSSPLHVSDEGLVTSMEDTDE